MHSKSILIALVLASVGAHAEGLGEGHAHEHGKAALTIAMDKSAVEASLSSPAVNIVGFEHNPHGPEEQAAISKALDRLRLAGMIRFNGEAYCRLTSSDVHSPFTPDNTDEHKDIDATFHFDCHAPGQLHRLNTQGLLSAFPGIRQLKVEYDLPGAQGSRVLTADAPQLELAPQ